MLMLFGLPDADKLFLRFFDRWYTDADREANVFPTTRPDILMTKGYVGREPADVSKLSSEGAQEQLKRVVAILDAAKADWPTYLGVKEPVDLNWVKAFDKHYNKKRVADLVKRSDPDAFNNDYLVVACEFGSVLGYVLKERIGRLEWMAASPYWECSLFDSKTGSIIPVFHWAIKKLSSYGLNDGFGAKVEACINRLGEPDLACQ